MKKFVLSTILLAVLFSCKKTEKADELVTTEEPKTEVIDSTSNVIAAGNLAELNQTQLNTLVASKLNDTIYVTNFFATWCGPCMKEIPHFIEKKKELEGKPVKFTFVSLDAKEDWPTAVSDFADEYNLRKNLVLVDGTAITPDFFTQNFKTWDGGSIPFTVIKKGDKSDETVGMMSKEDLATKLNSFK